MDEWVITLTYELDPSMGEMDRWAEQLVEYDGHASRPRSGAVDVTVHAPITMDVWDAGRKLADAVAPVVGARPIGVEVITEAELLRRAGEPTMPELMSAAEISQALGVSRQRVHKLRSMREFPAPLAELRSGAVWDAAAVRKFAAGWERKPGRPRLLH
jgi:predicted DNA-binding transcriptional regulator AlpA